MPLTNPRQERNETGLTVRIFGDVSDFNAAVREARDEVRKLNYELAEAVRLGRRAEAAGARAYGSWCMSHSWYWASMRPLTARAAAVSASTAA